MLVPGMVLVGALSLSAQVRPAIPDLSGTWYVVDSNSPVTSCVAESDGVSRLEAVNNGVNLIHSYT
jgi:hypothetical protein